MTSIYNLRQKRQFVHHHDMYILVPWGLICVYYDDNNAFCLTTIIFNLKHHGIIVCKLMVAMIVA